MPDRRVAVIIRYSVYEPAMGRRMMSKLAGICAGVGAAAAIVIPVASASSGVVSARGSSWAAPHVVLAELTR